MLEKKVKNTVNDSENLRMAKEIHYMMYLAKSKEWSTRMNSRLQQFQALPMLMVRDSQPESGPRCINCHIVRPEPARDDSPSTACKSSSRGARLGGTRLGGADPPCFGQPPPGIHPVPSRQLPPPPPPPPSSCSRSPADNAAVYPLNQL